ncbi:magnesium transporter [Candidatus Roizmanbacteria bacterium]|nr:magnesium transporter [Candidatus Roizmanbacteria bacterium]
MLYFSELQGHKAYTRDGVHVGRLKDVIFLASDTPAVTKIVIKTSQDPNTIIPMQYVKKLNGGVILEKNYKISELDENELFLEKNLLNNQIIDIAGDKVVRVNDVAIQDKPGYIIAGVDIGIIGILRWFRLEDLFNNILRRIGIKLSSQFLSWADIQTLELTRGHVKIKREQTKLERIRPEDLADYLEQTTVSNAKNILKIVGEQQSVEVINNLTLSYQTALFKQFTSEQAAKLISFMDPEEAVDVLYALSKKKREKILSFLSDRIYNKISYLLNLSETPIGGILTTEFLTVEPDQTAKEVTAKIRRETQDFYSITYVYVTNKDNQLIGVFDLHELLLRRSDTQVYKFMTQRVVTVHLNTPVTIVLRKLVKNKLYALPVVDQDKHLLGLVIYDDVVHLYLGENE